MHTSQSGKPRTGRDAFLNAAMQCMVQRGYHGTSIKDIASITGTTTAALYYHFTSKQDILVALMNQALSSALIATRRAVQTATSPPDRLAEATRAWALFHAEHPDEAMIGATELRSLLPENRAHIVAQRDEQEQLFRGVIEDGVRTGHFSVTSTKLAARAIIAMGNSIADWYRPDGALTPANIADEYANLSLGLVRADPASTTAQ